MNPVIEIEAADLRDCLDDGTTNPLWTMRGYTQVSTNEFKTHAKLKFILSIVN